MGEQWTWSGHFVSGFSFREIWTARVSHGNCPSSNSQYHHIFIEIGTSNWHCFSTSNGCGEQFTPSETIYQEICRWSAWIIIVARNGIQINNFIYIVCLHRSKPMINSQVYIYFSKLSAFTIQHSRNMYVKFVLLVAVAVSIPQLSVAVRIQIVTIYLENIVWLKFVSNL